MDIPDSGSPQPETAQLHRRCQWCSVEVQDDAATVCPGCGASLEEKDFVGEAAIPGVTVVDPEIKVAERRAARDLQRARTAGNGAMFGLTGVLLSKALSGVQAGRNNDEPDVSELGDSAGLTPTGLAPGGVLMAPAAAPMPPAAPLDPPAAASAPIAPSAPAVPPAFLPKGAIPATYVPVALPPAPGTATAPQPSSEAPDPWRDMPSPSMADQVAGTEWDPWAGTVAGPAPEPNELATPAGPPPTDPWAVDGGPWSGDPEPPKEGPSK